MPKTQRIRDPVHDLIVFRDHSDIDQLAWELINTREFQRLRRIRQLGFSEFVFPGATHTRFSHCVGVYQTARELLEIIKQKIGSDYDEGRAEVALCAALLHDIGHGPFSHAFENAEKKLERGKNHESWGSEIIKEDTEVHSKLVERRSEIFADEVAGLLAAKEPKDIYSSVVSSQFDADRLDYIRRDRYMTGTGLGHIDFGWLLDCLEVEVITISDPEHTDYSDVQSLILNYKGLNAAESYLLARINLFTNVYMHKTTRGAEKLLGAFLEQLAMDIAGANLSKSGVPENHPLVVHLSSSPSLETYLLLDDDVIWSALNHARLGKSPTLSKLGAALLDRKLYKCFDPTLIPGKGEAAIPKFMKRLQEEGRKLGLEEDYSLLIDEFRLSPYGLYSYDDPGVLQKILIGHIDGSRSSDIVQRSEIISGIKDTSTLRIYLRDGETREKVVNLWREVNP